MEKADPERKSPETPQVWSWFHMYGHARGLRSWKQQIQMLGSNSFVVSPNFSKKAFRLTRLPNYQKYKAETDVKKALSTQS